MVERDGAYVKIQRQVASGPRWALRSSLARDSLSSADPEALLEVREHDGECERGERGAKTSEDRRRVIKCRQ